MAHTGSTVVSGEGHTVPERVGPRGVDNAASLVLVCLPCAQAVNPPGRRPLPKKKKKLLLYAKLCTFSTLWQCVCSPREKCVVLYFFVLLRRLREFFDKLNISLFFPSHTDSLAGYSFPLDLFRGKTSILSVINPLSFLLGSSVFNQGLYGTCSYRPSKLLNCLHLTAKQQVSCCANRATQARVLIQQASKQASCLLDRSIAHSFSLSKLVHRFLVVVFLFSIHISFCFKFARTCRSLGLTPTVRMFFEKMFVVITCYCTRSYVCGGEECHVAEWTYLDTNIQVGSRFRTGKLTNFLTKEPIYSIMPVWKLVFRMFYLCRYDEWSKEFQSCFAHCCYFSCYDIFNNHFLNDNII